MHIIRFNRNVTEMTAPERKQIRDILGEAIREHSYVGPEAGIFMRDGVYITCNGAMLRDLVTELDRAGFL